MLYIILMGIYLHTLQLVVSQSLDSNRGSVDYRPIPTQIVSEIY